MFSGQHNQPRISSIPDEAEFWKWQIPSDESRA